MRHALCAMLFSMSSGQKNRKKHARVLFRMWALGAFLFFLFPAGLWAATETLNFPILLDYPLIQSLLVQHVFREPGGRAIPLEQPDGCARIELWAPEVASEGSLMKIGSRIKIKAGVSILGLCLRVTEWEGYVEVLQQVWLNSAWQVRFETKESRFYDQRRNKVSLPKPFYDLVATYLYPYLDAMAIDLSEPKNEIREFLPLVFPPDERPRAKRWLDSIRPGQLQVDKEAVRLNLLMEVEILPKPPEKTEKSLSPQEMERLTQAWESWDAFLVHEMKALIGQPLTDDERRDLLDLLIETRSQFTQALKENTLGRDLVREQFVSVWGKLSRVLRKYLVQEKSLPLLNVLAFFSASDALVILDKLGPALNIEISRDGLLRLARLLLHDGGKISLDYSKALDPRLREFFGLGPPLDETGPAFDVDELELLENREEKKKDSGIEFLRRLLIPVAHAEEAASPRLTGVKEWIPPEKEFGPYIGKIQELLEQAILQAFSRSQLETAYQTLYRNLILATAWQESCWRQFVKSQGKVRYLVSYNQTSVGLMQINERVWRGFYRLEHLRWDIRYNVRAGCEILNIYIRDHAMKRRESRSPLDPDTLVRVTYAMYNAGPKEYDEFLKRSGKNVLYHRDKLFWQKYIMSQEGRFDGLSVCLGGE